MDKCLICVALSAGLVAHEKHSGFSRPDQGCLRAFCDGYARRAVDEDGTRDEACRRSGGGASRPLLARSAQPSADDFDDVVELRVTPVFELSLHLVHGVEDSGVVPAAETRAYLGQRRLRERA